MYPQSPNQTPPPPNDYDFITNPAAAPKRSLGNGSSMTTRLVVVLVGLLLLMILFVGAKNILTGGGGNVAVLIKVANRQQELVAVTTTAKNSPQTLSGNSAAIVATTQISLTSAQAQLLAYLKTQNQKVSKKQLIHPGASAVTAQLTAAAAAGNYDATLQQVLKNQLLDYQATVKQAYDKTSGARGRELLQKDYDGATLLLRQFTP